MLQYQCNSIYKIQKFNTDSTSDFVTRLSYETWGIIIGNYNVDAIFIYYLVTYLKIIYCSFPGKIKQTKQTNITNPLVTLGTEVSCHHKRELYISCRNISDQNLINHYKSIAKFCLMLSQLQKSFTTTAWY